MVTTPREQGEVRILPFYTTASGKVSYSVGAWGSFPGIRWLGREADHARTYNAKIKNVWSFVSVSYTPSRHGVYGRVSLYFSVGM